MKHLPAIDGLRAIAVLAVVAYHAGLPVPAGFVGVDVFFVISGYLITSLLIREQDKGGIDLLNFYARRVRRIFPAAAVVVLTVLGLSAVLLGPTAQAHTANSAGAALAFVANVFFQFTSGGYFDGAAEEMPLLHLWSLSVEEQFYFLWPGLLILSGRHRVAMMIGLALASFVLAEWLIPRGDAAFYQMPARFWELAAGGLIAASPARALPRWIGPAGVLLTLVACLFALAGHFPGVGALPAVAGAAMVIAAVHGGARIAVLEVRPMVWIGLISYSLYLWHWPLLAFYRATAVGEGSLQVRLALCAVAFVLAFASYRYIEQPFRRQQWPKGRTVAVGASVSAVLAISACAVGYQPKPTAPEGDNRLAWHAQHDKPSERCHAGAMHVKFPMCVPQPEERVLLWGDSMAWFWKPFAEGLGPVADMTRDGCGPFVGYAHGNRDSDNCIRHNAAVLPYAQQADTVILTARWRQYGGYEDELRATLEALRGVRRVIVIGPSPTIRDRAPLCLRRELDCAITRAEFDAEALPRLASLRAMAPPNVEVLDVSDYFCTATECPVVRHGAALYYDNHHVSVAAARAYPLN